MTLQKHFAVGIAALVLTACGGPPPAAPSLSTKPSPPQASAEPAPLPPVEKKSAGLQVVLDLKKTPIKVAIGTPELAIYSMRGRTFIAVQDVLFYVDGDALKTDGALRRGISDTPEPSSWGVGGVHLGAMGGHWPDAAWAQVNDFGERSFAGHFLRWNGEEWVDAIDAGYSVGVATRVLPLASGWSLVSTRDPWNQTPPGTPKERLSTLHPRWRVPIPLTKADSVATLSGRHPLRGPRRPRGRVGAGRHADAGSAVRVPHHESDPGRLGDRRALLHRPLHAEPAGPESRGRSG
jgi:hypothetical protein